MDNVENTKKFLTAELSELNEQQWESLCDQCGRCCLVKLEDDETGEVHYTNIVCRLYDIEAGRCSDYPNRKTKVPECIVIREFGDEIYTQLPQTCAYRIRFNHKPLPQWHPLVAGNTQQMQNQAIPIWQQVVSEENVHEEQLQDHIIDDIK